MLHPHKPIYSFLSNYAPSYLSVFVPQVGFLRLICQDSGKELPPLSNAPDPVLSDILLTLEHIDSSIMHSECLENIFYSTGHIFVYICILAYVCFRDMMYLQHFYSLLPSLKILPLSLSD